ncbi:unnamed protein product [Didymodactylos carnosus]|uniref:Uncharacterized protein n=2 Tax=Didymodactylos carnosus TaxID=1234261 RepID=A0A8S2GPN5_9BILA|nr:unnamed protein product [Didymodactylos carnosus]CAF3546086.1 unnamed protein product [Didymodactylos carnosus]
MASVGERKWTGRKKEYSGSVDEAVQPLGSKIEHFKFHMFVKRELSKYFEKLKAEVTDEKLVCQVDFAKNYGMKEQDEVQCAHWYTKTMSIFTGYVRSKSGGFGFALPSLDVTHDKFVVNSALELILNHLKTLLPNLKEINFSSDGAASQFKHVIIFEI